MVAEAIDIAGQSSYAYEVLVVDNGSTDGSPTAAVAAGADVIDEPVRGYGSAIRAGITAARHDIIIIADADGQHDLSCTPDLIAPLLRDGADVVIGRRLQQAGAHANHWLKRRVGAPALSAIGRTISGAPISDFHCSFRAGRRETLQSLPLRTDGMEFASEMIVRAHRAGLVLAEVGVRVRPPLRERPPHLRPLRDAARHIRCMLQCSAEDN